MRETHISGSVALSTRMQERQAFGRRPWLEQVFTWTKSSEDRIHKSTSTNRRVMLRDRPISLALALWIHV